MPFSTDSLSHVHPKVVRVLTQAKYLSSTYHIVVANPPYMGGGGMNGRLKTWVADNYPASKTDLFAIFIERNLYLVQKHGMVAMITMQSWMFLSSFEVLRAWLLGQHTLLSMAHLGARAFDSIGGEVVSTTAFVLEKANRLEHMGAYIRLVVGNSEAEKNGAMQDGIENPNCGWFYRASAADLKKIPGSPIAYWVSNVLRNSFLKYTKLGELVAAKSGMSTTNNDRFLRVWFEVSLHQFKEDSASAEDAAKSNKRWFPYIKGGSFRKWYGNLDFVVNWKNDGEEIKSFVVNNPRDPNTTHWSRRIFNSDRFFQGLLAWSRISMGPLSVRRYGHGMIFSDASNGCFGDSIQLDKATLLLNSKVVNSILEVLSPTMNFYSGDIERVPAVLPKESASLSNMISLSKEDWNSYETSWDFTSLPLLNLDYRQSTLKATYRMLHAHWREISLEMKRLEEENNRIFIEAYCLQDELTPEVPFNEITLTCNPHYRYGNEKSEDELEALLLADTMREFLSYAVGCMFGRYSIDKPGLILANQGETLSNYLSQIPEPTFTPDEDNVIPILNADWFMDDIVARFRTFLKITFGEEHYEENLNFIEDAIGKDIRKFFLKDFYADHIRRYKKRPIYWLFSSPKGSFNALIYMHRYRPDMVSIILNDYLREFRLKLIARKEHLEQVSISASASNAEKSRALKEIEKLKKTIDELQEYENNILYPLATQKIEIDLDDGVKVNYPKFGKALKDISGLS